MCPSLTGSPAKLHWPIEDPSTIFIESDINGEVAFKTIYYEIHTRVKSLFQHGFLESILQVRLTFGSLLDNLTDGVMAHDLDRRIYFFNRAAQRITGFNSSEVVGRDCHDVFPGRFCGGDCSFCEEKVQAQSKIRYPQVFVRQDGDRRELEMSVVTINTPDNDVVGALIIFRDLTEIKHIRKKLEESRGFQGIIGRHISMQKVFDTIQELSNVNVPILIQGESGTGKEMVAIALHNLSSGSSGPFVPINCGALPEGTLESELFGHVKGAFTGAIRDKKGRFELAEGGTIFLDEIGEVSPNMQVKLLRVLQEKAFVPVGGEKLIRVNVRIICATNKDLKLMTQQGLFREDLYYRLAVVPITLPALREKPSDIPLLVEHFLEKFSSDTGKLTEKISPEAMKLMMKYPWPGNVRELRNAIQFGMIKCRGSTLEVSHLPPEIGGAGNLTHGSRPGRRPKLNLNSVDEALKRAGGNKAKAARLLGVSRTSIYRFLNRKSVT
ncbi:MAG: sigma 54-interacting transcriptional regulator [candidate division Zixibacteria bacterium]|nr:sigma 54-interacting transcriptional regulator [Candidatus Tariuqbacter arcticus]